jgi:3-phosphoshikimate 1-carboxyvinyltransferase
VTALVVHPAEAPLRGSVPAPPDAAKATVAALVAAHAEGRCSIGARGLPELPVVAALRALGVEVVADDAGVAVEARGVSGLRPARGPLECGASAETMVGLAAVLAARPFVTVLGGDAGAARVSMLHAARTLRRRGAQIEGRLDPARPGVLAPPIEVGPAPGPLSELVLELAPGDWAGKDAALLSGLHASGPTLVAEPLVVAGRTERLLAAVGARIDGMGPALRLEPLARPLEPFAGDLAGDGELSLLLLAAGLGVPGSRVGVRGACTSAGRGGWLELLRDAGCPLEVQPRTARLGEAAADVHTAAAELRRFEASGEVALRAGAGAAALCAVAALATGESRIEGDAPGVLELLRAFGVGVETEGTTLVVAGGPVRSCRYVADDPLLAMAATVLALRADAPCRIDGAGGIARRFPRFVATLRALGARVDVVAEG